MKPAMNQHNGDSHVNNRMHRPSIVDDEASAPEGCWQCGIAEAPEKQPKAFDPSPPQCISVPDWAVWIILGASIMGTLLIVHFGAQV